ncbi:RloB domain-containing protein, partial [bacterium]
KGVNLVVRHRKSIRRTKKTVLIVGEGPTEKAFLRYLKELYITRDMDVSLKVECASGGSPRNVVEKTIRLCGSRGYDKCFVLIDADVSFNGDKKLVSRMNKKPKIKILKASPCIEGLFLLILNHKESLTSEKCKSLFESKYLASDKKTDWRSYERIFTKQMLDDNRKTINELNVILKAMEV